MENTEYVTNVINSKKDCEAQHSVENENVLTSAENLDAIIPEGVEERGEGKETCEDPTVNKSGKITTRRDEDFPNTLEEINVGENVCNSIPSTNSNELSAINGKIVSGEMATKISNSQVIFANTNTANNDDLGEDNIITLSNTKPSSVSAPSSINNSPSIRYSTFAERHQEGERNSVNECNEEVQQHKECEQRIQQQMLQYEQQLEQIKAALQQKDNMITLFQRENAILEKEKEAFRKEKDLANKEKESVVIKFAMKEKSVIDAKKEKELVEKQLAEARKEIKNYTTKFQALNEEKSRVSYLMDEKCTEVRRYQRECEKLKTDYGYLESKLKYHMNKLNMEAEAKLALEKKLEEERHTSSKLEDKANENSKIEFEAQTILLRHEIANKKEHLDKLFKETEVQKDVIKQLQDQLNIETKEKNHIIESYKSLQDEHNHVQNSYSDEMLNSAKLRGQLEELQVLKTQNTLNEHKIFTMNQELEKALQKVQDNEQDLEQLHAKEKELLSFNKEMSESIVDLQNQICLLKSEAQGTAAENDIFRKEYLDFEEKYAALKNQLKQEENQKNEDRILLAKHLSEKTKLYENTKIKLENVMGDFEATKHKHVTIVKELQREIVKLKRVGDSRANYVCSICQNETQNNGYHHEENDDKVAAMKSLDIKRSHSRQSGISTIEGQSVSSSRRGSGSSESDTVIGREIDFKDDKGPSKKHLVERILRLQQASARQTEKIDFLEQHTLSLVAEIQKKSKVVQYYMLRDQVGALTSLKSDQNKSELAKYGNGVMAAIYSGIKGVENKSMTLELSLEINKKLQAVLEDTLLKNITLKENLDVLGLEVDNLTRKLRQLEATH